VAGGLIVATSFIAFGVVGQRPSQTVVYETMEPGAALSERGHGLSAHDIYVRDARSVVFIRATPGAASSSSGAAGPQAHAGSATGSGFLIRRTGASGLILTTYDVVENADARAGVTVQFDDDGPRAATVVAVDESDDLALLRVATDGLPPIPVLAIGDSAGLKVGDPTLAIADPFGSDRTLTSGIVSALAPQIEATNGFAIDNVIETDAPALPGDSGAPLLDAGGRVIGINALMTSDSGDGAGGSVEIPFAVPIDTVKAFLASVGEARETAVASLGVTPSRSAPAPSRPRTSAAAGVATATGVAVAVQPGGPAAQAGLRTHDAIEAIDGHRVEAISDLDAIVAARSPGMTVSITILRGRRLRKISVVLGRRLVILTGASRMYR
jgi:putative serine protease PepD